MEMFSNSVLSLERCASYCGMLADRLVPLSLFGLLDTWKQVKNRRLVHLQEIRRSRRTLQVLRHNYCNSLCKAGLWDVRRRIISFESSILHAVKDSK